MDTMGADPRPAMERSASEKTLLMEVSVAKIRAIVISVNIAAYLLFTGLHAPRAPLAFAIITIASGYAVWSLFGRPYERYPLLRFGGATLAADAVLITLWVFATGGARSDFWIIYVISVISVAMRYDIGQTIATALAEASLYFTAMALDGGLSQTSLAIRPVYIIIAGYAAGSLARQERLSRRDRIVFEQLANQHAEMLERERKVVDKLRELDRMKTQFVANASHELRTPITALVGYAGTIAARRKDLTDEQLEESVEVIQRQTLRLDSLINNLLDLSQIEFGRAPLALQPVNVRHVVERVLEVLPSAASRLTVSVDASIAVAADPMRLEQVLTNLVTNAVRYGGPHITVSAARVGHRVELVVADDGEGIPASLLPELFHPFARGSNTQGKTGSGLGLAISRRLVEALGGELDYRRRAGGGSEFVVRLGSQPSSSFAKVS